MPLTIENFLSSLPVKAGVKPNNFEAYYKKNINTDSNTSSLSFREIFDFIANEERKVKEERNNKTQKDRKSWLNWFAASDILNIKRALSQHYTNEIAISSLLPNSNSSQRSDDRAVEFEQTRDQMIALMEKYGYRLISRPELKFEFVGPAKVPEPQYKMIQLRDPADKFVPTRPVPCLIPGVSTKDNCSFYTLLDRAVSTRL